MSRRRVTGLTIPAVAAAVIVCAALTPVGGWVQSFVFGTGVRWQDAYRALDALEPAIRAGDLERRRVAWAQAEDEPPAGMAIGSRIHPAGVLARLQYETFDAGGAPAEAWEVRALVPRLPDITPPKSGPHPVLGDMGCPAECQAELKRSHGTLITRSGQPGIAGECSCRARTCPSRAASRRRAGSSSTAAPSRGAAAGSTPRSRPRPSAPRETPGDPAARRPSG